MMGDPLVQLTFLSISGYNSGFPGLGRLVHVLLKQQTKSTLLFDATMACQAILVENGADVLIVTDLCCIGLTGPYDQANNCI
jgi:hypothetical protein